MANFKKKPGPKPKPVPTAKPATKPKFVQKVNSGALFPNEDKQAENHPDFKGSFTDQYGSKYWISAWKHVSTSGVKYLSIAATPQEENHGSTDEVGDEPFLDDPFA